MSAPISLREALASRHLFDQVAHPVFIVNRNKELLYNNRAFQHYSRMRNPTGKPEPAHCFECLSLEICESSCIMVHSNETRRHTFWREVVGQGPGGEPLNLAIDATPLYSESGEPDGALIHIHDLTDEARLQEKYRVMFEREKNEKHDLQVLAAQLAEANDKIRSWNAELERKVADRTEDLEKANEELESLSRMKSDFISRVSHELNTPLTSILGFSEILREPDDLSRSEVLEFCSEIYKKGKRMQIILNDILTLLRIEGGLLGYTYSREDLNLIVASTVDFLQEETGTKNLDVSLDLAEDLPPLKLDHEKIRQVVINLISNAVKFTPEGGWIRISTRMDGDWAVLTVTDSGKGIPVESLDHVFETFAQLDSILHHSIGLGLGLALSREMVERGHGGKIEVSSAGPGTGSTFVVKIPSYLTESSAELRAVK